MLDWVVTENSRGDVPAQMQATFAVVPSLDDSFTRSQIDGNVLLLRNGVEVQMYQSWVRVRRYELRGITIVLFQLQEGKVPTAVVAAW